MPDQSKTINLILWITLGILSVIVVSQFVGARRELETSRARCYATAGKEACEAHNVR